MSDVIGLVIFMVLGLAFTVLHVFVETYAEYRDALKREIEKDRAEFGHCCELESGQCTYQPKIDKLNKTDPHHKQSKK